jgi:hypothetical protein
MTIEQTVEIPADHRLTIEVPPEIPAGRAILAFTPAGNEKITAAVKDHRYWKAASAIRLNATVLSNDPPLQNYKGPGYTARSSIDS